MENLDELIYSAMVKRGWLFPQTVEEVEAAEKEIEEEVALSEP